MNNDKRKRDANWDEVEKSLLKRLVSESIDIVECKDATTNTHKKKKQAWEEIYKSFNHLNGRKRDLTQLIKQWRGMKMQLKQVVYDYRREVKKTGGGPKPAAPPVEDMDLIEKMQDEFSVDLNRFDSNNRNGGEILPKDSLVAIEAELHVPPPESDLTYCSLVDTPVTTRTTAADRYTSLQTNIEFIDHMSREHEVDFTDEVVMTDALQDHEREQGDQEQREEQGEGERTQGREWEREQTRRREQVQGRRKERGPMRNKNEKHEDILRNKLFLIQKRHLEEREKREISLHEQTMRHNQALYLKKMAILELEEQKLNEK